MRIDRIGNACVVQRPLAIARRNRGSRIMGGANTYWQTMEFEACTGHFEVALVKQD